MGYFIQAKLKISQSGDAYEQEADKVADEVMRMSEPTVQSHVEKEEEETIQSKSIAEHITPLVQGQVEEEDEEEKPLQAKEVSGRISEAAADVQAQINNFRGSDQPLPKSVRAFFEPRFGYDFSHVRVHTNSQAAETAEAINARAFTVGQDVVFGAGKFEPETVEGRRLLAHELTHVVQQQWDQDKIMRIPEEDGISETPPRYSYSTNCGWIDWSHASPGVPIALIQAVREASDRMRNNQSTEPEPVAAPAMESRQLGILLSGVTPIVRIKRPLSDPEILSVALRIFMLQSLGFEALQNWTDSIASSSFSEEDLPSNLIAFYMGARGFDRSHIETTCSIWNATDTLAEFHRYHFQKIASFVPIRLPSGGRWPADLLSITPAQAGGPLMDIPEGRFETLTTTFQRGLIGYEIITNPNLHIENLSGGGPVNIAGTEPGPEHGPHFEVRPLPSGHNLQGRWVIKDESDRRYRMLGNDGNEVFHFRNQFNAFINAPTRELLRGRGITNATILCRVAVGERGEHASMQRLLELAVTFTW
jgi:hypothetical protein